MRLRKILYGLLYHKITKTAGLSLMLSMIQYIRGATNNYLLLPHADYLISTISILYSVSNKLVSNLESLLRYRDAIPYWQRSKYDQRS